MMALDIDARIREAMKREAQKKAEAMKREAQKKAEEDAAKQREWESAVGKSRVFYTPMWMDDITDDVWRVLDMKWVNDERRCDPLRFCAALDDTRVFIEWRSTAGWRTEEDTRPRGFWSLTNKYNTEIDRADLGQLADTLFARLGRIRQERAEKEAEEARERAEREEAARQTEAYWAAQRREQEERGAHQLAAQRARWQDLVTEDAIARPMVDAYVEQHRFRWPDGARLTLYCARWCDGWTYEDDGPTATHEYAWGLTDQPDDKGYYFFAGKGGGKHIRPPLETLTWERYAVDGLDTLPARLRETDTIWVPGFDDKRMGNPDSREHGQEMFYVRQQGNTLRREAGQRPVRWVREALGITETPTTETVDHDDLPF